MNRILVMFLLLAAETVIFCPTASAIIFRTNPEDELDPEIHLEYDLPGGLLSAALNAVVSLIRSAVDIVEPLSPSVHQALEDIVNEMIDAVNNFHVTSAEGLLDLAEHLTKIVAKGIEGVEGFLNDAASDSPLQIAVLPVVGGLRKFQGAVESLIPVARVIVGK